MQKKSDKTDEPILRSCVANRRTNGRTNRAKFTAKNTVISPNFLVWKLCERNSFRIVSGDSAEAKRKLCLSTKFPYQEIR